MQRISTAISINDQPETRDPTREELVSSVAQQFATQGQGYDSENGRYFQSRQHTRLTLDECLKKQLSYIRTRGWGNATPEELAGIISDAEQVLAERRKNHIDRRLLEFRESVGKRLASASFENYTVSCAEQGRVKTALQAYAEQGATKVKGGVGIVLTGPSGAGKDHLLGSTAKAVIQAGGVVKWVNGQDLLGMFRDRINSGESEEDMIAKYVMPAVLVISDALPPSGALTDYQSVMLYRVLDGRYRECRPTWVSMNVANRGEADARMGAPLVDRLRDGALCLACNWPSYRKPVGQEAKS